MPDTPNSVLLCYLSRPSILWLINNDAANTKTARALLRRTGCQASRQDLDSGRGSEHPDYIVTEGEQRFGLEVCEIFTAGRIARAQP